MLDRYSRQARFWGIGPEGQDKIEGLSVAIIGMGALGSASANLLVRAGVGRVRLIDRDIVELSNLQRQVIYTEQDVDEALPKAVAAARHLAEANSNVTIEPVVADFNPANALELLDGFDMAIDGADNFEVRYLANEVCVELGIPFIYGGAIEGTGMVMPCVPGGPCFACLNGRDHAESSRPAKTCSTVGVLASTTTMVAALQCSLALKLAVGEQVDGRLVQLDVWEGDFDALEVEHDPDCPICVHKRYRYLGHGDVGTRADASCGGNTVQVSPAKSRTVDLQEMAATLSALGKAVAKDYYLDFKSPHASFILFEDGRAIIRHVHDEGRAKSIYAEYIGL